MLLFKKICCKLNNNDYQKIKSFRFHKFSNNYLYKWKKLTYKNYEEHFKRLDKTLWDVDYSERVLR